MFAALAFALAVSQPAPAAEQIAADTATLADDRFEGRATGSTGYAAAADHVEARMRAAGLRPGGTNGFRSPVSIVQNAGVADGTRPFGIAGVPLATGTDLFLTYRGTGEALTGDYEMVFVGDGFDAPEYGSPSLDGLDLDGKIAVAMLAYPKAPDDVAAHLFGTMAERLAARGAVGLVQVLPGNVGMPGLEEVIGEIEMLYDDHSFYLASPVTPELRFEATAITPNLDALFAGSGIELMRVIGAVLGDGTFPVGPLARTARLDFPAAASAPLTSDNVIGIVEGSDPDFADEILVVTGHLDHMGIDPELDGDRIHNGAMDNAIGSAVILEAARTIAAGTAPRRSIAFVMLAAEEQGLLGSRQMASAGTIGGRRIVGNVNIDMPLLFGDFTGLVAAGAEHSSLGPMAETAIAPLGLSLFPDPKPEEVMFVRSDHYSFVLEGIPAIMIDPNEADAAAGAVNSDFLARHYHKPSDQSDLPIDYDAAARLAEASVAIIRAAADAPAPTWNADSRFNPAPE